MVQYTLAMAIAFLEQCKKLGALRRVGTRQSGSRGEGLVIPLKWWWRQQIQDAGCRVQREQAGPRVRLRTWRTSAWSNDLPPELVTELGAIGGVEDQNDGAELNGAASGGMAWGVYWEREDSQICLPHAKTVAKTHRTSGGRQCPVINRACPMDER